MIDDRIEALSSQAKRDEASFENPSEGRRDEVAMRYLRDGVGPAISIYVSARTGDQLASLSPDSFDTLESAMNRWLELYALCYGVEIDGEFTLRTAAELLVETHNVRDVAQLLTSVPDRHEPATRATNY